MKVYARKALGHARIVAAALHDPQLCPIEQTRMLFNDHSVVAIAAAADAGLGDGGAGLVTRSES